MQSVDSIQTMWIDSIIELNYVVPNPQRLVTTRIRSAIFNRKKNTLRPMVHLCIKISVDFPSPYVSLLQDISSPMHIRQVIVQKIGIMMNLNFESQRGSEEDSQ